MLKIISVKKRICILMLFCLFLRQEVRACANNIHVDYSIVSPIKFSFKDFKENTATTFHLFSHGKSGKLFLNGKWKDSLEIVEFLKAKINSNTKHINIYGCEFGKGTKGLEAITYLERELGCTVAASNDLTGIDGNWNLEVGQPINLIKPIDFQGNLQCTGIVGGTADEDDFDGDGICNNADLDDDNDGVLDYEESVYVCSAEEFDFSGIRTNMPSVGNLFTNRLLTQANTAYPGVTFNLDITEVSGSNTSSWREIRGNAEGDIAFARNGDGVIEGKLTFSEPITFSVNENRSLGGDTGGADSWDFSVTSGTILYEDLGTADFNVLSYATDSISLQLLNGDSDWELKFIEVSEITLRFTSEGRDNTSVISFEACATQDIDTDEDGVPNRFDLDSDGDGCTDAQEAGVSGTLIAGSVENGDGITNTIETKGNAIVQGGYGLNGLADTIETNDTFSAATTYTSTYIAQALDLNIRLCVCYKSPTVGSSVASSVGISTLNRKENKNATDWPLNRNSAYLVLDSHQKGLVLTRLTTLQINALTAVEGMLVYDINKDCLKMFDGSSWFCLSQTCIDN